MSDRIMIKEWEKNHFTSETVKPAELNVIRQDNAAVAD